MYELNSDPLSIRKACEILDISHDTIRRWEKKGLIKTTRDGHGQRLF